MKESRLLPAVALCALVVPYATGLMAWAFREGFFPIKPILYIMVTGCVTLWLAWKDGPVFSRTMLVAVLCMLVRTVDAALERYEHPLGSSILTSSYGNMVFIALCCTVAAGSWTGRKNFPLLAASAGAVLVGCAGNFMEAAGIFENSTVKGRAAGFLGDPNDSSICIDTMLAVFLTLSRSYWHKTALIAVAAAGVGLTLSRSGMLVFFLVVMIHFAVNLRPHFKQVVLTVAGAILLGVSALAWKSMNTAPGAVSKDSNADDRMAAIFGGDTSKMGSNERVKDLQDGVDGALLKPLLGHGAGAGSSKYQPHNMLISIWVDFGLLGAGVYMAVLLTLLAKSLLRGGDCILCVIPLLAFIPFSQMLLDHTCMWFAASIAAVRTCALPVRFRLFHPVATPSYALPS